jgi:hypothetical protein
VAVDTEPKVIQAILAGGSGWRYPEVGPGPSDRATTTISTIHHRRTTIFAPQRPQPNPLTPQDSTYCGRRGAGNNWADGYVNYGQQTATTVLEMLQREVEQADALEAFLILSSVAGGTGSGLGTRLTELIRDAFPSATILNVVRRFGA